MICLGKVKGNLMIDLNASNEKRRAHSARMLASLRSCAYQEALQHLAANSWNVSVTLVRSPNSSI